MRKIDIGREKRKACKLKFCNGKRYKKPYNGSREAGNKTRRKVVHSVSYKLQHNIPRLYKKASLTVHKYARNTRSRYNRSGNGVPTNTCLRIQIKFTYAFWNNLKSFFKKHFVILSRHPFQVSVDSQILVFILLFENYNSPILVWDF